MITLEDIKKNKEVQAFVNASQKQLKALGYTEHSNRHIGIVSKRTEEILTKLGYDEHTIELAKIAAYMHDIGNVINRDGHAKTGAVMAFRILDKLKMKQEDIATIISAIGNHDESSAYPVSVVSSALILADKTDVRRTRVRQKDDTFSIHSRVNYAAKSSRVIIDKEQRTLTLNLSIDTNICSIMDYFEIFLSRMMLCKKACEFFNLTFKLLINEQSLL